MHTKVPFQDTTFLIPLRIDSIQRLENVLMVIDFLTDHFSTNIHVLEATGYNNKILAKLAPQDVLIRYVEDCDPIFYHTQYINMMVKHCQTPYLAVWDADVIIDPKQIVTSVEWLRHNEANFAFPYENDVLEVNSIVKELYQNTQSINTLMRCKGKMTRRPVTNPVGGAFLASKKAYFESGLENEHFYGWGGEDNERSMRLKTLGYTIKRASGPLFHFTHKRGINSRYHSREQKNIKSSELLHIYTMSKKELETEVKTWKHVLDMNI